MNPRLYVDLGTHLGSRRHYVHCRTSISRDTSYLRPPPSLGDAAWLRRESTQVLVTTTHNPSILILWKCPSWDSTHQVCTLPISLHYPNCTCCPLSPWWSMVILLPWPSHKATSITSTPSSNVTYASKPSSPPYPPVSPSPPKPYCKTLRGRLWLHPCL